MKILQVITSFPPAFAYGGPAGVVYDISKELVKRGHEVTVYTTDVLDKNSRYKFENNPMWLDGIKVYHFKNISNHLAVNFHISSAVEMAIELRRNIHKFDVVHCHDYRAIEAIFVHYYAQKRMVPYILQPRGTIPTLKKSNQKQIFDKFFGYEIIKDANKIIASSKIESKQYSYVFPEFNNEKVIHVPNGVNLKTYQDLPKKGSFKDKYSINKNDKIILFLSRIHERKGADLLIEAFYELKNDIKNVKLIIAGPDDGFFGELMSMVVKLGIENEVLFPGPLYGKNKLEAYVDADIFVLPSKDSYESFGNVVLESLACGTPVIVTNVCGVTEWVGNTVYVVEPEVFQIRNSILEILNNNVLYEQIAHSGINLVNSNFGWNKICSLLEKIYFSAMDS